MIFLYTLVLLLLGLVKLVTARRAASLERKYSKAASKVLQMAHEPAFKAGNGKAEPVALAAKRTFELGLLVRRRDLLEAKYFSWRAWADKLGRAMAAARAWKGVKLPYTMGVFDVWLVLYAIDRLGMADALSPRVVIDNVVALLGW